MLDIRGVPDRSLKGPGFPFRDPTGTPRIVFSCSMLCKSPTWCALLHLRPTLQAKKSSGQLVLGSPRMKAYIAARHGLKWHSDARCSRLPVTAHLKFLDRFSQIRGGKGERTPMCWGCPNVECNWRCTSYPPILLRTFTSHV